MIPAVWRVNFRDQLGRMVALLVIHISLGLAVRSEIREAVTFHSGPQTRWLSRMHSMTHIASLRFGFDFLARVLIISTAKLY